MGGAIGAVVIARLIGRVGHIRTFAACAALLAVATLIHALVFSPWLWAVLRLLAGIFFYGLIMTIESWLNERASNDGRGRILAAYMILLFLATMAGQWLLNASSVTGDHLFILSAVFVSASLVPVAMLARGEPEPIAVSRLSVRRMVRLSRLAVTGAFAGGTLMAAFYALGPLYAERAGLSTYQLSLFMSAGLLGGLALQWPLGWLSDYVGRRTALTVASLLTIAAALLLVWLDGISTAVRLVLVFAAGGGLFALYPLSLAQANDRITANAAVEVNRSFLFIYAAGSTVAPAAGGAIMATVGPDGLFLLMAVVAAVVVLVAVPERTLPRRLGSVFVALPHTLSYASGRLDPRRRQHWTEQRRDRWENLRAKDETG